MTEIDPSKKSALLEGMADGVYVIRHDYIVTYMNQVMIRDFGDGVGRKCYEIINRRDEKCPWCQAEKVFAGETVYHEIHVPHLNRDYNITEIPLRNEDGTYSKLNIFRDITQIKKREEKLKASEKDYRNLFEHVACGIYISSKEGKFLDANQALLDMLGYESKEEFLNIDIARDLYVRSQDRRKFIEKVEADGFVRDYEVEFKRKDGTPLSVLLTSHVRKDANGRILGYEGINVDLTERIQMERKLKAANDFMNAIVHQSPNAIISADMNGKILLWNRAAEEMLGFKAEEVIGIMNIMNIYPNAMAKKIMKMIRAPQYGGEGKLHSFPLVYKRSDGGTAEGNLSAAILYGEHGEEIATVGIFVDMEERLAMERRLHQTQEQLLQSEKLAAMGRLTSQLAHELNNPLYGIMNTLELLKSEISPQSKRRKILEMALSETIRLADMLKKMLSFSKPDQEEKHPVDINTILDEILMLHEKQLQEHSIKLRVDLEPDLSRVMASKNQLRQVFLNMIGNARDAMPDGGVLNVNTGTAGDQVAIKIIDTGCGIDPEHIDKIFDTFFTTKDAVKGVGLGLSVCYGFIRDHGGDITVDSKFGEGTCFTITLPVYQKEDKKNSIKSAE